MTTGSSTWLHKFKVPERFSTKAMKAMEDGVISKGVRVEVIGTVATQMLQHTLHPTHEVCISFSEILWVYNKSRIRVLMVVQDHIAVNSFTSCVIIHFWLYYPQ